MKSGERLSHNNNKERSAALWVNNHLSCSGLAIVRGDDLSATRLHPAPLPHSIQMEIMHSVLPSQESGFPFSAPAVKLCTAAEVCTLVCGRQEMAADSIMEG